MNNAQKEYETFKSITTSPYDRSNTAKLNIIYTIVCRAEKDESYKKELESFIIPDGSGMNLLEAIDTFFQSFNNSHGIDIRLSLSPFDDPNYPNGLYFVVRTYKRVGDSLEECAPMDFKAGEEAVFRAVLHDQVTDEEIAVPIIKYYVYSEDGSEATGGSENTSFVEFSATCNRPGAVRAAVTACNENGEQIKGSEKGVPGALFDFTKIETTLPTPKDFESFWKGEVERLKKTDPTDTAVTPYNGKVVYAKNVTETNFYHIKKADSEYLALLRSKHLTTASDDILDKFDLWEYSLKCPGPCPATGYVSVPKGKEPHSLPMEFIYDGYGAHAPHPFFVKDVIAVHATHHGYPCALTDGEYYKELNGEGILGSYAKGNGKANSYFEDIHDCYALYIHLRNLQTLRFLANAELSSHIPQVAEAWNGSASFGGSSLGGYQTIAMCAFSRFLDEKVNITIGRAEVPGYCNYAGPTDKRLGNSFDIHWSKNAEYFDAAHMATLVESPMLIPRNALGDEVCVSSAICMAYNNFKGEKEIRFLQNSSHGYRAKTETQLWYTGK